MEVHDGFKTAIDIGTIGRWVWDVALGFPKVEKVAKGEECKEGSEEAGEKDKLADSPFVWEPGDLLL